MKQRQILTIAVFFMALTSAYLQKEMTVIFTVDMNDQALSSDDIVGIRGSMAPLSWNATTILTDEDGDGIYSTKITFETTDKKQIVYYKFVMDNENLEDEELSWELDRFGGEGNRFLRLNRFLQYASPAVFDYFDSAQKWTISEWHAISTLSDEIHALKEHGISDQDIGRRWGENADWEWAVDAATFAAGLEYSMNSSILLDMEILEWSPEYVQLKVNYPLKDLKKHYGMSEEDGYNTKEINTVIHSMYYTIAEKRGLDLKIEDQDMWRIFTIKKK